MAVKHSVMAPNASCERLEEVQVCVCVEVGGGGGYTRELPPKLMYNQALIPRSASDSRELSITSLLFPKCLLPSLTLPLYLLLFICKVHAVHMLP